MIRKLAAALAMITLVAAWPVNGVSAQAAPASAPPELVARDDKEPPDRPAGFQAGRGAPAGDSGKNTNAGKNGDAGKNGNNKPAPQPSAYSRQAPSTLIGAFDRAMAEIDAAPATMSPTDVKGLTFRRRLLELRLLMDTNSFIYNHDQMKGYRDAVDAAYQAVGDYQDISVTQKLLDGYTVDPAIVNARLNQMNDALGPLRDQGWRNEAHAFFAAPRPNVRSSAGSPRLWDEAGTRASDQYDQVGNAALFEASVLRALAGQDLGVSNVYDPDQIVRFHAIRKDVRSMLVLATLFPELNDSIQDAYKALDDLNDDYDDTHDAYNAWVIAQQAGLDTGAISARVDKQFSQSQDAKNTVIATDALNVAASHLEAVRDAHRV